MLTPHNKCYKFPYSKVLIDIECVETHDATGVGSKLSGLHACSSGQGHLSKWPAMQRPTPLSHTPWHPCQSTIWTPITNRSPLPHIHKQIAFHKVGSSLLTSVNCAFDESKHEEVGMAILRSN